MRFAPLGSKLTPGTINKVNNRLMDLCNLASALIRINPGSCRPLFLVMINPISVINLINLPSPAFSLLYFCNKSSVFF